ncbi:hypothetical protein Q3G72_034245 [Acer saccharum]|nr:hypothetical protein Q3G72_034245 [Acer saccharum]
MSERQGGCNEVVGGGDGGCWSSIWVGVGLRLRWVSMDGGLKQYRLHMGEALEWVKYKGHMSQFNWTMSFDQYFGY